MTEAETIARWVSPGARVLDLGCGDGRLLQHLWRTRQAPGYGVEIGRESCRERVWIPV